LLPRERKPRNRKILPASQRRPDIRAEIEPYIARLVELYETTDPGLGPDSEEDKLENARWAISMWWYLFGELLLWAQSHLAGYEIAKANPDLRDKVLPKLVGHELTVDSHVLEYIGLGYSWNRVNYDDPMMEQIQNSMEKYDGGLDTPAMRNLIQELLSSNSANSSFWRFELKSALFALNLGQLQPITRPEPTRRQGNPLRLLNWKVMALQHVNFQIGKGLKKYRALQQVADALGQSTETLRSWEKFIAGDDDMMMAIRAARLAGELESQFDKYPISELEKLHATEYHRHTSDVEYAKLALKELRSTPLEKIRDGLRSGRMGKPSGS
jgi:hypothetical protein